MFSVNFEYPYFLLVICIFILANIFIKHKSTSFYISNVLNIPMVIKKSMLIPFFKWLTIVMMIIALSSPYKIKSEKPEKLSHSIMMLLDVSASMSGVVKSKDNSDEKLTIAKKTAIEFIEKQKESTVGLIVFADFAYVATPLTFDKKSVNTIISNLKDGIAGSLTSMYDALFLSTRLLKKNKAKEKVLILLTDGYNTAGVIGKETVLRALSSQNIRVYTIGIGEEKDFDKQILTKLAEDNEGKFYKASSLNSLNEIYKDIDKLEKSLQKIASKPKKTHLYYYPLGIGFLTLLIFMYFFLRRNL